MQELATMASLPKENTTESANPDDTMTDDDAISTQTAPTGTKTDYVAKELKEFTLRFEYVVAKKEDLQLTILRHIEVLRALSDCAEQHDIIIYDNKNTKVINLYDQKWKDLDYFKNHFTVHSGRKKLGMSFYVIHRVRTNMSVKMIKSDRNVFRALQGNNGYLKTHHWSEDVWKVQDIGFLLHYDPNKHPKEHVQAMLAEKIKFHGIKPKEVPAYKLVHSSPNSKVNGTKINAQAYSIQVESSHASKMDQVLKTIHKEDVKYVQYKMKGKMQAAYARAIQEQARYLQSIAVVSVFGVTDDMMFYMQAHLLAIDGVQEYLPTVATEAKGKWNLIVERKQANNIKHQLSTSLSTMILELVDEDARRTPPGFPEPSVQPPNEDEWWNTSQSDGGNSYMSLCAQSYNSFEGDATIEINDTPFATPTYATITKGNSEQISEVTTPEMGEVAELRAKVKQLEDHIRQLRDAPLDSTGVTPSSSPPAGMTIATTGTLVENEIAKRMLDIESRMESEMDLRMENSIQRAVMIMMKQLRLEQACNLTVPASAPHTPSKESSDMHQDSKKRDRKRTTTKSAAGRAHGGRGRANPTMHDTESVSSARPDHRQVADRRNGMEIDCNSDSDFSAAPRRNIFDGMDSDSTMAGPLSQAGDAQPPRLLLKEAKLKNV